MNRLGPHCIHTSKPFKALCIALVLSVVFNGSVLANNYSRMKVVLKNGVILEGKYVSLDNKELRIKVKEGEQLYQLSEVQTVSAKVSKAGRYAAFFGGGCCALGLVVFAVSEDSDFEDAGGSKDEYLAGLAIWTALFAGAGYLIGRSASHWDVVYITPDQSRLFSPINMLVDSDRNGGLRLGLTYSF